MKKKLFVVAGILLVLGILIVLVPGDTKQDASNTTSATKPDYVTTQQTIQGTTLSLTRVGDIGDGVAWEAKDGATGSRVRIITEESQRDKVKAIYVWAQLKTDEANDRLALNILNTIANNTAPSSTSWLKEAYGRALKKPGETQERAFDNKNISVGYADQVNQLTFREDIK